MTWRWDASMMRWCHGRKQLSQAVIDMWPREKVQEIATKFAGEPLPDEAWPAPGPVERLVEAMGQPFVDGIRMEIAADAVRAKLASVEDVRELYTK